VWSNRIVGYSIDSRMKARLAVNALNNTVARRAVTGAEVAGCIVHADRGSQGQFNWSLQYLDQKVFGLDRGSDGTGGDALARAPRRGRDVSIVSGSGRPSLVA
jgi:hypothetical protein